MNKTIYEAEFTKMVHDKMREANKMCIRDRNVPGSTDSQTV